MKITLTPGNAMEFLTKIPDKGIPLSFTGSFVGRDLWATASAPNVQTHSLTLVIKADGTWEAIANLPAAGE